MTEWPRWPQRIGLLMIAALWGCIPIIWFLPGLLVITGDWGMPYTPAAWWRLATTWDSSWGAGAPSTASIAHLGFTAIPPLLQRFGASMLTAEAVFFVMWF